MSVQTPSDLELPKLDESPDEQRSKRPATDDSPGPAKQARTDFGPMYPGVNRNTRGWGAFSRNDMKAFCTAEKHPSTTSTSPLVLDFKLSSIATSYSYPAPGQYAESTPPSLPSVAPRMAVAPTPSYWQQQQQYQPTTAFQSSPTPARHTPSQISQRLFQQAATTPPSPPYTIQQTRQFQFGTELSRSSFSSTSNRSSAPTYSNASAYNDSQSYSNSPVQGPYGAHVSRGAGALEIEGQQEDAVLALQTLASASEQRPYLALASINSGDVGGTLSHMPATTGMSSQPSMAAAHQNNYHLPQATQAYQPRDTGGMSFEQVSAREPLQQQGFTGGSSSLNWGIGFPLVSTGGDADRKPYGHMG